ncbi:MAG: hypothetical protein ACI9OJ_005450 [Myxococcota bacterium]|jgi:hypothetical protein
MDDRGPVHGARVRRACGGLLGEKDGSDGWGEAFVWERSGGG